VLKELLRSPFIKLFAHVVKMSSNIEAKGGQQWPTNCDLVHFVFSDVPIHGI
jgi:hypothetical protein